MVKARWKKYVLNFKKPGGTSRGVLYQKPSWFIILEDDNGLTGIGECGMLPGLSADDKPEYESVLETLVSSLNKGEILPDLIEWPSIRFGLEMARRDLTLGEKRELFPSKFTAGEAGIDINGLVWMGTPDEMRTQIEEKLAAGFNCIKLKIGAIDFEEEISLIGHIRKRFSAEDIIIRVDANGAFSPEEAPNKLERLAALGIHSIEQPIRAGQWDVMRRLCETTPLPIALDEELIGINDPKLQQELIDFIRPQAIILKPSFVGGFAACDHWINLAENAGVIWCTTSALESNIGLNAIAQYTFCTGNALHQGLGTGQLYTNNIESPLFIQSGKLYSDPSQGWNLNPIL
jgi:o-succinylbenzoate synthase